MSWLSLPAMSGDATLASFAAALRACCASPSAAAAAAAGGDAVAQSALLCAALIAACALGSRLTGTWSFVDRCWSLAPPAYALLFAAQAAAGAGGGGARVRLMAALAVLWGARLTANFARKGGYSWDLVASEDYRWPVLRRWLARAPPAAALAFELLFVAAYQHVLLALIAVPPLFLAAASAAPLGGADAALAAAFLAALAAETWTDEVQWAFQRAKHAMTARARAAAGGDFARGFCTTGPFALSRHLNFFAEQSMWWVFWGFSVAAGAPAPNWAAAGALLLTLLFLGSTWMTELLTAEKYPAYRRYQLTTSRLMPWWPGPPLDGRARAAAKEAPSARKRSVSAKPASAARRRSARSE